MRGLFTDLNIYSSFFNQEEMLAWSGCDHKLGDIFGWKKQNVNITYNEKSQKNVSFVKIEKNEVCLYQNNNITRQRPRKSTSEKGENRFTPKIDKNHSLVDSVLQYIESPVHKSAVEAQDMCFRLSGELMTVPQNKEEKDIMRKVIRQPVS